MAATEKRERAATQKALDTLAAWGKNPNTDGGESIGFSLSRQGAPSDAFLGMGDCTPFTMAYLRELLGEDTTREPRAAFSGSTLHLAEALGRLPPSVMRQHGLWTRRRQS